MSCRARDQLQWSGLRKDVAQTMADKKDGNMQKVLQPLKGLLGVLCIVLAFLLVLAGVTFLVNFILK